MQAKCWEQAEYALYTSDGSKTKDGVVAGAGFITKTHTLRIYLSKNYNMKSLKLLSNSQAAILVLKKYKLTHNVFFEP